MSTLQVTTIQSNSSATLPVIKDSAGTEYGKFCRAFVNFDGTGSYPANQTIRASFNVSSVYKSASAIYTVSFTNAMPDANYIIPCCSGNDGGNGQGAWTVSDPSGITANYAKIVGYTSGGGYQDQKNVHVSVFR